MGDEGEYFVYVLSSKSTGMFYVGQTGSLQERVRQHNSREHNLCKFTSRQKGPWRLIYYELCSSRSEAMKRERWFKSGIGREWLNRIIGGASPPQVD